jgi:hypothetical protein
MFCLHGVASLAACDVLLARRRHLHGGSGMAMVSATAVNLVPVERPDPTTPRELRRITKVTGVGASRIAGD